MCYSKKLKELLDRHFNKFDNELSYNELKMLVPDSETEVHDMYIQKMYIAIHNIAMMGICFIMAHTFITDKNAEFGFPGLFFGLYLVHIGLSISYYRSPFKHNSWKPEVLVILDQVAVFLTCFDGKLSAQNDAALVHTMTQRL